jgi:hypothetical protein
VKVWTHWECGCHPSVGWFEHAWRYSKVRYWSRYFGVVFRYLRAWLSLGVQSRFYRFMASWQPEMRLGLGLGSLWEAQKLQRGWEDSARRAELVRAALLGGCCSKGGRRDRMSDFVTMGKDEWEHWFGREDLSE